MHVVTPCKEIETFATRLLHNFFFFFLKTLPPSLIHAVFIVAAISYLHVKPALYVTLLAPDNHVCKQWWKAMGMISIYHESDKEMAVAHDIGPWGSSKLPQFLWYPKWPSFVGSGLGGQVTAVCLFSAPLQRGDTASGNQSSLMCQQGHPFENISWFYLPCSANPQLSRHSSVCSEDTPPPMSPLCGWHWNL